MDAVTLGMAKADARKRYSSRQANTIVWFGDSITGNGDAYSYPGNGAAVVNISTHPRGFWCHAQNLLGQRLRTLFNAGIGGNTTTQMLARIQTDVIAYNPSWCHVLGGTNDVLNAVPRATTRANLTAIWDALDAAGIRVVAGTIPPSDSTRYASGTNKADLENLNGWILNQGRVRKNFVVVDYHASLAAMKSLGVYDTGLTFDGTHPSSQGAFQMGKRLAAVLSPLIPNNIMLSNSETDSTNLIAQGGRFATGGSGAVNTASDGSFSSHMPAGATYSKAPRTDGVNGQWQVFTTPAGGGGGWIQFNITPGAALAVGDMISAAVEYDISGLDQAATTNSQYFYLKVQSYNGTAFTDMIYDLYTVPGSDANMSAADRAGILRTPPVVVPAGTTVMTVNVFMYGGGTFKLDRVTARNITKQGFVD